MRKTALLTMLLAGGGLFGAEITKGDHPYKAEYKKRTFGPKSLMRAAASATWGEITNKPDEWGRTSLGYGIRFLSGFGTNVVRNSVAMPIAAALHEDIQYHRSTDTRFSHRLEHALVTSVWTHRTTTGQGTLAYGQISGTFAGGLISRLWQPASIRTFSSGFASAGVSFGAEAGFNVVREFWPRKKNQQQPAKN